MELGATPCDKVSVARAAFAQNNREESRLAHSSDATPAICERGHLSHAFPTNLRKFVELTIWGGNQGVLVCCVLASGLEALLPDDASASLVPSLCIITLFGLALAFGFLDYVHRRADKIFGENEREREKWECDNFIEGEQKEMVELYVAKGMKKEDAETVIKLMSKYEELFIDVMMAEELGILPYSGLQPELSGLVTGASFFTLGALPLAAYSKLGSLGLTYAFSGQLEALLLLAGFILLALSALKSFYCLDLEAWWKQGIYILGLQAVTSAISFGLGSFLLQTSLQSLLFSTS